MRRLAILSLLAGCLYGHDPRCEPPAHDPAPLELLNPDTLACQSFSTPTCNSTCGPCVESGIPFPTWGRCNDPCLDLNASACAARSTCRVARAYAAYWSNTESFIGCYPLDQVFDQSDVCANLDAQRCSQHGGCTALYEQPSCNSLVCPQSAFKACVRKAQLVGTCRGAVTCDIASPTCPTGTTPGITSGCYTGSCIPNAFCR